MIAIIAPRRHLFKGQRGKGDRFMQRIRFARRSISRVAWAIASAAAIACCGALHPAAADVRYTMAMEMAQSGGSGDGNASYGPQIRRTVMLKDRRQREEMTIDMGPMHQDTVTLTECDKQQVIQLDPALKIYSVQPMESGVTPSMPTAFGPRGRGHVEEKAGTGKMVSTISVQDLGTEKILDLDTHHFMLSTQTHTSGCAGDSDTNNKIEMWVAPIKAGLNCPEMYSPSRAVTSDTGCQMTVEQHGDFDALRSIYGGMPVRIKMYNGDRVIGEMDMREYSTAALDPSLFDVPPDFKQVSAADFQQQEQQAMMNSARNAGPGAFSQPPPPADNSQDQGGQSGADQGDQGNGQNGNSQGNANQNNSQPKHHGFSMPFHL